MEKKYVFDGTEPFKEVMLEVINDTNIADEYHKNGLTKEVLEFMLSRPLALELGAKSVVDKIMFNMEYNLDSQTNSRSM